MSTVCRHLRGFEFRAISSASSLQSFRASSSRSRSRVSLTLIVAALSQIGGRSQSRWPGHFMWTPILASPRQSSSSPANLRRYKCPQGDGSHGRFTASHQSNTQPTPCNACGITSSRAASTRRIHHRGATSGLCTPHSSSYTSASNKTATFEPRMSKLPPQAGNREHASFIRAASVGGRLVVTLD